MKTASTPTPDEARENAQRFRAEIDQVRDRTVVQDGDYYTLTEKGCQRHV